MNNKMTKEDCTAFYKVKMGLCELKDLIKQRGVVLPKECSKDRILTVLESALILFDATGDECEEQGIFSYPEYDDNSSRFYDDAYNDILKQFYETPDSEAVNQNGPKLSVKAKGNKPFTKSDLRTGDVILRRNQDVEIVVKETGTLIAPLNGCDLLSEIDEDLTYSEDDSRYDIISVRRPIHDTDCCFEAFDSCLGELVYDINKNPVHTDEMGLEKFCKEPSKNEEWKRFCDSFRNK